MQKIFDIYAGDDVIYILEVRRKSPYRNKVIGKQKMNKLTLLDTPPNENLQTMEKFIAAFNDFNSYPEMTAEMVKERPGQEYILVDAQEYDGEIASSNCDYICHTAGVSPKELPLVILF